jgi:type II secretory pathway component PulK
MSLFRGITGISILLFLALVGMGCGSSSDSSAATPTLTKASYIKQADVRCKKIEAERKANINAFMKQAGIDPEKPLSTKQHQELVLQAILQPVRDEAAQLKALGAPDKQSAELLDEFEKAIDKYEEDAKSGHKGTVDPFSKANAQAQKYGFKQCMVFL